MLVLGRNMGSTAGGTIRIRNENKTRFGKCPDRPQVRPVDFATQDTGDILPLTPICKGNEPLRSTHLQTEDADMRKGKCYERKEIKRCHGLPSYSPP